MSFPFAPEPDRQPTDPEQTPEADPGPGPTDDVDAIRGDKVLRWRAEQFAKLDFNPRQSRVLALDKSVDLERARQIRGRGCEVSLAFDILS